MIDTDKYEGHTEGPWAWDNVGVLQGEESVLWVDFLEPDPDWQLNNSAIHVSEKDEELIADAPLILEAYKRLREEVKVLSKYRDIVNKYDDALLADGDTDLRWSELYD